LERNVITVKIHPEWDADFENPSRDSDIALIEMSTRVDYSGYIRPICLWPEGEDLNKHIGSFGIVAGWGLNEQGNVNYEYPKLLSVPIIAENDCLRSHDAFRHLTSNRTFCAGSKNQEIVCK
jgi:hypothetical protein